MVAKPITATKDEINGLRERAINTSVEKTNARTARPFHDLITFFKDNTEFIKPEIPESIQGDL